MRTHPLAGSSPPRIGVLGTMVWDTIVRDDRREPVEEWGGITYGLSAMVAALPDGWEIVPIIKVGRDLAERAQRYLRDLPGLDVDTGVREVPEPNNRVELTYEGPARRSERLRGGVPPWEWAELAPIVRTCDALYVNFISGFEMGLDTAMALGTGYEGPTYSDLHSLFLDVTGQGLRVPRQLPEWRSWLRCFDAIQMNEDEFGLLGQAWGDPWKLAAEVVGPELKLITVTLGSRGAAYVAGPAFTPRPERWPALREKVATPGTARSGRIPPEEGGREGDPTGCGDVWGSTFFSHLLRGDTLEDAMKSANAAAARNVDFRGARGLHHHLQGRLGKP